MEDEDRDYKICEFIEKGLKTSDLEFNKYWRSNSDKYRGKMTKEDAKRKYTAGSIFLLFEIMIQWINAGDDFKEFEKTRLNKK